MAFMNEKLARKVDKLEKRITGHDEILIELVHEIRQLIETPKPKAKKQSIGFIISNEFRNRP